ncbi:hypothetical protein ACQY0O_003474 [Thecaphora frezii]
MDGSSSESQESPAKRSSLARQASFSSIKSRIRRSSFRAKRRSKHGDDDGTLTVDNKLDTRRWSSNSEQSLPSLPPLPPLPPRPPVPPKSRANEAPPLPARPAARARPFPNLDTPEEALYIEHTIPHPDLTAGAAATGGMQGAKDGEGAAAGVTQTVCSHAVAFRPSAATQTGAGPLQEQIPTIMLFFGATCLAVQLLSRVHWLLALTVAGCSSHVLWKKLESADRDAEWELEMAHAARRFQDPDQREETVEWLNSTLAIVWPLISSDYFVPFVDLLEDSLMTQVPGIVHSVRVEDLDQGTIPIRIKSFKLIPPDEASFLATPSEPQSARRQGARDAGSKSDGRDPLQSPVSADDDEDPGIDTGDYINLEVVFAYRGTKPKRNKRTSKSTTNDANADSNEPVGASDAYMDDPAYQTMLDTPVEKIHMLIYMGIGLQKIAAVEVPVWVEMIGIEGRMRIRLQLTPVVPFVKHAAITFVSPPRLEMSAKPLGKKMVIDAMNLPLISSYALRSVEDVIKGFIAPKSYTIDVAGLLGSGDGPNDAYAIGLVVITFHQASDLAAADANGSSDPFVQASFSHSGKPLFTTRVLRRTIHPIWQETAFLLVTPDELRDRERLRLTVFDADRFSADDPLGKVEISIDSLVRKARLRGNEAGRSLLETRLDRLKPMRRGAAVQGRIKYSVGFYELAQGRGTNLTGKRQELINRSIARAKTQMPRSHDFAAAPPTASQPPTPPPKPGQQAETSKPPPAAPPSRETGSEKSVQPSSAAADESGDDLHRFMTPFDRFVHRLGLPMDDEVLKQRRDRKERVDKLITMIEGAKAATVEPPEPSLPTGLLAFHIHSIHNLEVQQTQRSYSNSKRLSQKQSYVTNSEETLAEGTGTGKLPSSYVQVFINDEAVFRTRTKSLNPRPYINAGSERVVTDFATARIDFTVRDARMREGDPILGCVGLRLVDVLKKSSRSTAWYTLTGGLGYGKIRITLLWRSFVIAVPKPLRGWNVGIIELGSCIASGLSQQLFEAKPCHILFETVGGRAETSNVEPFEEYESGIGDAATVVYRWPLEREPVRVAVRQRYPNFLYIHLRSESRVPGRHHKHAYAVVPLSRIADDTFTRRRVPLYETSDLDRFEQDMLNATTRSDQLLSPTTAGLDERPRLSAALEEICETGNQELPPDAASDNHIKRVGWLELNLIYHRGIGPEHGSCVAGDHEMRFAYETYVALIDSGVRPKSHSLSVESRRRLSNLGARPTDLLSGSSSSPPEASPIATPRLVLEPSGEGAAPTFVEEPEVRRSMEAFEDDVDDRGSLYAASVTDSELEGFMDDGDPDSPEGRRARQRALHRQQRGAAQLKGFRTLSWLKTNAEDGVGRVKRQFGKQSKRIGKMESEGVSYF